MELSIDVFPLFWLLFGWMVWVDSLLRTWT